MNSMTSDDKYNLLCVQVRVIQPCPVLTLFTVAHQSMRNEIQVVTCIGDVAFSALAVT